jgi:hypothetical protein
MHDDASPAGADVDASPEEFMTAGETAIDALLRASHLAAPHHLPGLIAEHAAALGARDAVTYLTDLQETTLIPFLGSSGPHVARHLEPLPIDSTLAGRAFQHSDVMTQAADAASEAVRVWLPLLDGTARLGVLTVTLPDPRALDRDGGLLSVRLRRFAALVAELVAAKSVYGDTIARTRRLAEMGLAAEIQWAVLPPLTFACEEVVVAATLEPAYQVAGDSVDYAVDAGYTRVAVFDGMGHGLQSAQLAALSIAAYRNARRSGRPLSTTAEAVDSAVVAAFGGDAFVTAVIAELDTATGMLSWINAGHPEPLLLREGRLVKTLRATPGLPLGLALGPGPERYEVATEHLQPGDRVLFYTDGIVEARSPAGELFGVERLVDLLVRNYAAALPAPETMRRVVRALLEHQEGQLDDDATMLLVEWRSGTQGRLLPDHDEA